MESVVSPAGPTTAAHHPVETLRSWVVCLVAGLLFFYEFIQMNMFNAISHDFMQTLKITPQMMGGLDSFYFIANVIFLIPAGYLLDRYSIRNVILAAMMVCVLGTAGMAATHITWLAMVFRFLTGIGSAFCFLSCIRLATHWFPPRRIGLIIGVIVTEAMFGGMMSQTPLALLTEHFNWQTALVMDAGFGLVIWMLIFAVVRDAPDGYQPTRISTQYEGDTSTHYSQGFRRAFMTGHNWKMGAFTSLMNFPLGVLGGIWGISYLTTRFGLAPVAASTITSMLFLGMMVGSPLAGFISDTCKKRSVPMALGGLTLLTLMVFFLLESHWSHAGLMALFFLIGLFSGAQVIGYPAVSEKAPPEIVAMSVSVVNISVQSGLGVIKPLCGEVMYLSQEVHHNLNHALTALDYKLAMWLLPVLVVLALVILWLSNPNAVGKTEPKAGVVSTEG